MARNADKYLNSTSWNSSCHPTCGLINRLNNYQLLKKRPRTIEHETFVEYCLEMIYRDVEVVETILFPRI